MLRRLNFTRLVFLLGIPQLAYGLYRLAVQRPAGIRLPFLVASILFMVGQSYIGIRYDDLLASAPRLVEQFIIAGMALFVANEAAFVLAPLPGSSSSFLYRLGFAGFATAAGLFVWWLILNSVRYQASKLGTGVQSV